MSVHRDANVGNARKEEGDREGRSKFWEKPERGVTWLVQEEASPLV